jgi:hypothetical protein
MQLVRLKRAARFSRHSGSRGILAAMIMTSAEHRMGKWRKWYFGLAVLSALFLLESFYPLL